MADGKAQHLEPGKGEIEHYEDKVGVNPLAMVDPPAAFDTHRHAV